MLNIIAVTNCYILLDQEADQRKLGESCGKRLSGAWIEHGRCHGSY